MDLSVFAQISASVLVGVLCVQRTRTATLRSMRDGRMPPWVGVLIFSASLATFPLTMLVLGAGGIGLPIPVWFVVGIVTILCASAALGALTIRYLARQKDQ
jgi:hypothetical protein